MQAFVAHSRERERVGVSDATDGLLQTLSGCGLVVTRLGDPAIEYGATRTRSSYDGD